LTKDFYAIPISNEDPARFILFRPLLGLAFVGNQAMVTLARDLLDDSPTTSANSDASDFLQSIGFLEPDPPLPPEMSGKFKPTTAVLLMTNQCQLRCTYCYAAAGEAPHNMLTTELGHWAIDAVSKSAQEQGLPGFEVSFHGGGEPTMAWDVIKDCVDWARRKPIRSKATLTSNGIWSPEQCQWILHNLDGLSLSMDGAPETQNRHRPFSNGSESSTIVMRSLAEMDRVRFPYNIRMTATEPWDDLPRDVEFLCRESGCDTIQVEPAFNIKRGGHDEPDMKDVEAFASAYLESVHLAARAGRQFYYSGARLGMVAPTFCTAPYNALIVNPDGDLIACYEITSRDHPLADLSRVGGARDGQLEMDNEARAHLHRLMDERRAACRDCFCYWSCGGGCYTRSFGAGPEGHLHRGNLCNLRQRLVKALLLEEIAKGDGVCHLAPNLVKRVAYVQQ
jgi:uncharacterized protein